jgi:hypothetical protein
LLTTGANATGGRIFRTAARHAKPVPVSEVSASTETHEDFFRDAENQNGCLKDLQDKGHDFTPSRKNKSYQIAGRFLAVLQGKYPIRRILRMLSAKRLAIIPAALAACALAVGCVSYHKRVDETQPAPVVESVPAPVTSSTTTTTTDTAPSVVERQKTTTYSVTP